MSSPNPFYQQAKIYNLSKKEADLILHYAQKLGLDPLRIFANSSFFDQIVQTYRKETLVPDERMLEDIKEKLGFHKRIKTHLQSTKEIPFGQKGKFLIDRFTSLPIQLDRVTDTYTLWKVLPHRDAHLLQKGTSGDIVFEENFLIAYRFPATIQETREDRDTKRIKIPHTSNLKVLAQRRYPRVECDFEGVIRKQGSPRENPFYTCKLCNISEGGAKICLDAPIFKEHDSVILQFKINLENIEAESVVEAKIAFDGDGQYGLKFTNLDSHARAIIKRYVQSKMNQDSL